MKFFCNFKKTIDNPNKEWYNIIVTEMKEKGNTGKKSTKSGGKVTTEDVAVFCRQLAVMLSAGVPIKTEPGAVSLITLLVPAI